MAPPVEKPGPVLRQAAAEARAGFPSRGGGARRIAARAAVARLLWDPSGARRVPATAQALDRALSALPRGELAWLCEFSALGPIYLFPTRAFLRALASRIRACGARRVLEVAAGDGHLARSLAAEASGLQVFAADSGAWEAPRARMSAKERRALRGQDVAGLTLGAGVRRLDALAAIRAVKPDLVLASWLPPGPLLSRIIRAPVRHVLEIGAGAGVTGDLACWRFEHDLCDGPLEDLARCRLDERPARGLHTRVHALPRPGRMRSSPRSASPAATGSGRSCSARADAPRTDTCAGRTRSADRRTPARWFDAPPFSSIEPTKPGGRHATHLLRGAGRGGRLWRRAGRRGRGPERRAERRPHAAGIDVSPRLDRLGRGAPLGARLRHRAGRLRPLARRHLRRELGGHPRRRDGPRAPISSYRADIDPLAQAAIAVEAVGRLGPGDLPVTLDVEGESFQGVPPATVSARIAAWMDAVERGTGKPPMIYTGYYAWHDSVGSGAFGGHPLWIAAYGSAPSIPAGWSGWTFWQYSSSGRVPGIAGDVDLDSFAGSQQDLDKLAGSSSASGAQARDVALRSGGGGYVLDGFGALHAFGAAPAVGETALWPGWDIARKLALRADGGSGYLLDGWGGVHPFGGAPAVALSAYWQGWDIARSIALRKDGASGYVLDGYGGLHPFGGAPQVEGTAYWKGWDIARDLVLRDDGASGYVLDGYGGLHPFGGAPEVESQAYWEGFDIARSLALGFDGKSGYILDGFGGVHPFGGAPGPEVSGYWPGQDVARGLSLARDGSGGVVLQADGSVHRFSVQAHGRRLSLSAGAGYALDGSGALRALGGAADASDAPGWGAWDIARGVAVRPEGGGYVLDGYGGLHAFGGAPALAPSAYWQGWDIARALKLSPDGASGYVLDGFGGVHPCGGAPAAAVSAYWQGWDIARDLALRPDGASGYVLDGFGGLHPFGGAPAVSSSAYWQGWDIARAVALRPDGASGYVLDGFGGVHPFGGAPEPQLTGYFPGWDVARDLALDDSGNGLVLDVWGGVHPFAVP